MTHVAVEITCPVCAVKSAVPTQQVMIYRCTNRSGVDFYAWVCPDCDEPVTRKGDVASVCLLIGAEVRTRLFEWPSEADEPQRAARPWSAYEVDDLSMDIAALTGAEDVA